jgi:uncharacterized protein YcbK (DUF882 family)
MTSQKNLNLELISRDEILMGRDIEFPLTQEFEWNLAKLLKSLNKLRLAYGKPMIVTSGYRPGSYNKNAKGAKLSCHLTCEAADFKDTDGSFAKWCLQNINHLVENDLYMEEPAHTKGWVHLQIRPTRSGRRVFLP